MAHRLSGGAAARHPAPPAALAWADTAPIGLAARAITRAAASSSAPPRDYTAGTAIGALIGTSSGHSAGADRAATVAARRSFVALKLTYLDATAMLPGADTEWLREQVRVAEEPVDLWLLRAPLFSSLAGPDPERRRLRQRVRRALQAVFGEAQPTTAFASLR